MAQQGRLHLGQRGAVVVERVINLDHGIPINVTTQAGTAFDILAADCAACIERGGVEKQRVLIENKSPSQRRYS